MGLSQSKTPVAARSDTMFASSTGNRRTWVEARIIYASSQKYRLPGSQKLRITQEPYVLTGSGKGSDENNVKAAFESAFGTAVAEMQLPDPKAYQLLIAPSARGHWLLPSAEPFSRTTGTCRLIGDRRHRSTAQKISLGDCFRLGSVGMIVSEIHTGEPGGHQILSESSWNFLRNDIESMETSVPAHTPHRKRGRRAAGKGDAALSDEDGAGSDPEDRHEGTMTEGSEDSDASGSAPFCYICFDDEDTDENPLVAPCRCRGDTQFLHLRCLQRWYETNDENLVCAVYTSTGTHTCGVCKARYKTHAKLRNGQIISLRRRELDPPFLCFIIVTKHESASVLYQTRFQLSFAAVMNADKSRSTRDLIIGRSHYCDMPLDYRTISVRHASVRYSAADGFEMQDLRSSNGTLMFLRRPVRLEKGRPLAVRAGRATITFKPTCSLKQRITDLGHTASSSEDTAAVQAQVDLEEAELAGFVRTFIDRSAALRRARQKKKGLEDRYCAPSASPGAGEGAPLEAKRGSARRSGILSEETADTGADAVAGGAVGEEEDKRDEEADRRGGGGLAFQLAERRCTGALRPAFPLAGQE